MKYQRRSSSNTVAFASAILLLSLQSSQIQSTDAFSNSPRVSNSSRQRMVPSSPSSLVTLHSEVQTSQFVDTPSEDPDLTQLTGALATTILKEFELTQHKPLGCSVEESLASEPDGSKYVFVAEISKGGNAAKAGIRVGDVIVQLSGTFDEVVNVAGLGIDKIRSLVAGRQEESPLVIRVARGSDVQQRHELSLVELCIVGDEKETSECISAIYAADNDIYVAGDGDMAAACDEDSDTECMLDALWGDWSDELLPIDDVVEEDEVKEEKKKQAQPWASRSSGSGTYVRNPKTGKMENIDELDE